MATPTPSEAERYRYIKLKQQQQQPAQQPVQQEAQPQTRFQLKQNTPYESYGYGDAAKDTLKTLVNSVADLGQGISQPIMHPGQTLKGIGQAVMNPIETAQGIGQYIGGRYGSMEKLANTVSTDPFGFGSDVVTATTAVKGASSLAGNIIKNEKLAGHVVNSLIKPNHKQYMFGKNPGLGIAKEGIVAGNMESLAAKIGERINVIKDAVTTIRNTPENINKTIDLAGVTTPLKKAYMELKKAPKTHAAEIRNLEKAISDIDNLNGGNLNYLSVSDAYNIKDVVSKMQKWGVDARDVNSVNSSLRKAYHFIDNKIDMAIPELKELNSRWSNLISASQAIGNRMEMLSKAEPMSWQGLLNIPFAAARSTPAKTTLGRLLAKQYKLPK